MLFNIYLIVLFICFCIGLRSVYYYRNIPLQLKLFPWFIFLTFIIELIAKHSPIQQQIVLYNFFTAFEIVFLFYLLHGFLVTKWIRRALVYLIVIYPIAAAIYILLFHGIYQFHTITFLIGSVLLMFFSSYSLYELFFKKKITKPSEDPSFWSALGILFFYSGSVSIALTCEFLELFSKTEIRLLNTLLLYINLLYYSLFAIAFLCIPKLQKAQSAL